MSMFSARTPVSAEEARESIARVAQAVTETEIVTLSEASGRVLAADVICPVDIPAANNSAMDGYAMRFRDLNPDGTGTLALAGKSFAGHPFEGTLQPGQCIRIMTGAVVPDCCDTVIQQELTETDGNLITFRSGVLQGGNVRLQGEELQKGKPALQKGLRLTSAHIGLLASLGQPSVCVFRKPRVAVITTGDELVAPGTPLQHGQIYDANLFTVASLLRGCGADPVCLHAGDTAEALLEAFREALDADAVITSGGVSVGEADFTRFAASKNGEIFSWEIPMRPGRPMAAGILGGKPLYCLPGNPVAAAVTFLEFVRAGIRKLGGETGRLDPVQLTATAEGRFKKRPGRYEMQRGIFRINENGECVVRSTGMQSSAMLTSMCIGNCIVWIEKDRETVMPGEKVTIHPFFGLFSV